MTDNVLNLANVRVSFFDQLENYENTAKDNTIDPETLTRMRLDLIRNAKFEMENGSSPAAKRWYGHSLISGQNGFPVNIDLGIKYLNEAVMQRSKTAQDDLGDIYSGAWDNIPEDKIDFAKAFKHYQQADNGYSHYRLAYMYAMDTPHKDIRQALNHVEKSANHLGHAMGQNLLATWTYNGDYIAQDFDKAYAMFFDVYDREEISPGQFESWAGPSSLFFLGLMNYNGQGILQDEEKGYHMIEEAFHHADPNAIEWMEQCAAGKL